MNKIFCEIWAMKIWRFFNNCIAAWSCDQMFANDPERAEMGAKCEKRLGNLM